MSGFCINLFFITLTEKPWEKPHRKEGGLFLLQCWKHMVQDQPVGLVFPCNANMILT